MIKRDEMIIGETYIYDDVMLVLFKGYDVTTKAINLKNNRFEDVNYNFTIRNIKIASPAETAWLAYCIKNNSYIPYEEFYTPNKNESKDLEPIYKKLLNYEI